MEIFPVRHRIELKQEVFQFRGQVCEGREGLGRIGREMVVPRIRQEQVQVRRIEELAELGNCKVSSWSQHLLLGLSQLLLTVQPECGGKAQ